LENIKENTWLLFFDMKGWFFTSMDEKLFIFLNENFKGTTAYCAIVDCEDSLH
jgi:hypothetical protein